MPTDVQRNVQAGLLCTRDVEVGALEAAVAVVDGDATPLCAFGHGTFDKGAGPQAAEHAVASAGDVSLAVLHDGARAVDDDILPGALLDNFALRVPPGRGQ